MSLINECSVRGASNATLAQRNVIHIIFVIFFHRSFTQLSSLSESWDVGLPLISQARPLSLTTSKELTVPFLQMENRSSQGQTKSTYIALEKSSNTVLVPHFYIKLYGSKHWTINQSLISYLESCQAKLGKIILALPKFTSNVVPCLAVHWPSVRTCILLRKLFFLHRCIMNDTISGQVLRSILVTGTGPSLVQQCHFLEQSLGTSYIYRLDMILSDPEFVPSNHNTDQLIKLDIA